MNDVPGSYERLFVALIPPEPCFSELENIKKELFEQYGLRAALRSPAHITLYRPFLWNIKKKDFLLESFSTFSFSSFSCRLNGFGFFEKNRVLFARPEYSSEWQNLYDRFRNFAALRWNLTLEKEHQRPFYPHITLAFRDVKKEVFKTLQEIYASRPLVREFLMDRIYLLTWKDRQWEKTAYFPAKDVG